MIQPTIIAHIHLGKRDLEQHCPTCCLTYNSTELGRKTPTYGGKD